jgi:hypothetical protein
MFDLTYSLMMDKRDVIVDGTPFWKTGSGFCNWCDDPTIVYQPAQKSKFLRPSSELFRNTFISITGIIFMKSEIISFQIRVTWWAGALKALREVT